MFEALTGIRAQEISKWHWRKDSASMRIFYDYDGPRWSGTIAFKEVLIHRLEAISPMRAYQDRSAA